MWVKKSHSYNEKSMFHVNKPFEVWLEQVLNELAILSGQR